MGSNGAGAQVEFPGVGGEGERNSGGRREGAIPRKTVSATRNTWQVKATMNRVKKKKDVIISPRDKPRTIAASEGWKIEVREKLDSEENFKVLRLQTNSNGAFGGPTQNSERNREDCPLHYVGCACRRQVKNSKPERLWNAKKRGKIRMGVT